MNQIDSNQSVRHRQDRLDNGHNCTIMHLQKMKLKKDLYLRPFGTTPKMPKLIDVALN